ncbi:MAG TPA: ATP-binding protein [Gaiellaceae bacterium]|nr:ATP-binding protein [Gaiellaceae bacterium]
MRGERETYEAWLWGEVLLIGLLGAALALFLSYPGLQMTYHLPALRTVLDTVTVLGGVLVAVLAGARFSVEGQRLDLLLAAGFFTGAASLFSFEIVPILGGGVVHAPETWSADTGRLLSWALIAVAPAPFMRGRTRRRRRTIGNVLVLLLLALGAIWVAAHTISAGLPDLTPLDDQRPALLVGMNAANALLELLALIGFGVRFRDLGEDLDRWLAFGATLMLFASLHAMIAPLLSSGWVSQGDFLQLLGFAVLLVGVWRAIRYSEFARAVAEERARVAREIHDGLAQYLFAVSTHASMLEAGADPAVALPRLKEAAIAAQQEAKFAVLALSSASGNAPFDAALRRYVEFLTADGALEVDLEIDGATRLGPDEQIELFRIVQEGLANARRHAGARRVVVTIGRRFDDRVVAIQDDGVGFDGEAVGAGQGLKNMRQRAASIGGQLSVRSTPGRGTALEVVLRA